MSDARMCPACSAALREDGTCPQCSINADLRALAIPAAPEAADRLALGVRIAGAVLIVNAFAFAAELVTGQLRGVDTPGNGIPVVIDLVIGASLLSGSTKMRNFAILRTVLGLVLFGAIHFATGNILMVILQLAFSTSLLLLLVGSASIGRITASLCFVVPYFLLEAAGLFGMPMLQSLAYDAMGPPVRQVDGVASRYRVTAPSDEWRLRDDAAAKKDNALADRWLVRPDGDAHVVVVVETLPKGSELSLAEYERAVVENLQSGGNQLDVLESGPLAGKARGQRLHYKLLGKGFSVEGRCGLFLIGDHAYQVMAFAPIGHSPTIGAELDAMLASFEILDRAPLPH